MRGFASRHKWLVLMVVIMSAFFVIAACDDDDDNGDATATPDAAGETVTPEVAAPPPCEDGAGVTRLAEDLKRVAASGAALQAGDPLKLGVLVPSTGSLSTFGPDYINAANLAAKCINDAGGVNGGEVEIVVGDTGTDPEIGATEAERLVSVEGVVGILGAASSGVSLNVAESVTIPGEVLLISPASTSPALTDLADNDFVFRTPISDAAQGVVLGQLVAEDLGLTSVCALYVNNAYGEGLQAQFAETFGELGGTVTAAIPHDDAEAISYSAELTQCVADEPEALIAISYPTGQATVYLREALEAGQISEFVFVDGTKEDDIFETLGWENFDGMFGTAPGALSTEFGEAFDAMFVGEYGELYQTPFVREAFDAIMVMAYAAQLAGTNTDSVAIRDSLRGVANQPGTAFGPGEDDIGAALTAIEGGEEIDYQGASGSVDFDENGDITFGAIEIWRVDAANQELVTDQRFSVDLATGDVVELTD